MTWIRQAATLALVALLLGGLLAACGDDDEVDTDADLGVETEVVDDPTAEESTPNETEATDADLTETEADAGEATETPMSDASPTAMGSPQAGTPGDDVGIDDILTMPDAFIEKEVTVTGEIVEFLMTGAFTISDEDGEGQPLLVVGAGDLMPQLDDDSVVTVQGQVDMLTVDEGFLERLRDEFDIAVEDEEILTEFDGEPVIAASSVSLAISSIDELIEAPAPYIDQMVTLTGPVAGVLHPQALVMSENESAWTAEEALLVVGPDDVIPTESDPEALYQVRGTVHIFDPAELELGEEYRFLTLDDSFAEFEGEPILVAEMVDLALVPDVLGVLDAILDNPHSFIDEAVDISGNVVELVGTSAFTVGSEGDGELLVVTSDPTLMADLEAGGPVTASGTVRLFDLEVIEEESGIDLDDELFADFDGKPVIVADAVSAEGS